MGILVRLGRATYAGVVAVNANLVWGMSLAMGHRCRSHGLVPGLTTLAVRLLLSKISIFYPFALGEGDAGGLLGGEALGTDKCMFILHNG